MSLLHSYPFLGLLADNIKFDLLRGHRSFIASWFNSNSAFHNRTGIIIFFRCIKFEICILKFEMHHHFPVTPSSCLAGGPRLPSASPRGELIEAGLPSYLHFCG